MDEYMGLIKGAKLENIGEKINVPKTVNFRS